MFNETAHSVFVPERLLPCRVVVGSMGCIVYTDYVYPAFVPLLADISCLLFLFRFFVFCFLLFWFVVPLFFSFSVLFHYAFFLFYWPFRTRLLACLIRAAILHLSFRLHLFTSRCFVMIAICFISLQPLFFQMEAGLVS